MDPKFPNPTIGSNSETEKIAEKDLRGHVSEERKLEMEKYGRTKIYDQVAEYLQGDRQGAFSLVNHALAVIDDQIDKDSNIEHLNKAKAILNKGFQGEATELIETWEKDIFKLGQTLSRLDGDGFSEAKEVFDEVVNYWEIERQNLERKGKVLDSPDLDDLNLRIGKSVGLQFLALLCPGLDKESKESIAASYGLAIKLADNLSDLSEDLEQGYINIPKEGIEKYGLDVSDLNQGDLLSYKKTELERIKQYYEEADRIVEDAIKQNTSQQKGLSIFKDIAHSWLKQVSDKM
ncbi:MAG: squalene/phytoene synthase family protein [Patescibacteria group bacterium]